MFNKLLKTKQNKKNKNKNNLDVLQIFQLKFPFYNPKVGLYHYAMMQGSMVSLDERRDLSLYLILFQILKAYCLCNKILFSIIMICNEIVNILRFTVIIYTM